MSTAVPLRSVTDLGAPNVPSLPTRRTVYLTPFVVPVVRVTVTG